MVRLGWGSAVGSEESTTEGGLSVGSGSRRLAVRDRIVVRSLRRMIVVVGGIGMSSRWTWGGRVPRVEGANWQSGGGRRGGGRWDGGRRLT